MEDKSKYKNVAFIVTVGRDTSLFMIKPLNEEYNNVEDIHLEEYNVEIDRNDYNILKYTTYTDNKIDKRDLEDYLLSYQTKKTLSMEEIWNIGLFLEIAIIENIREVCERIYIAQIEKYKAENIVERLVENKSKTE